VSNAGSRTGDTGVASVAASRSRIGVGCALRRLRRVAAAGVSVADVVAMVAGDAASVSGAIWIEGMIGSMSAFSGDAGSMRPQIGAGRFACACAIRRSSAREAPATSEVAESGVVDDRLERRVGADSA
jgi:hypothetical protein